MNAADYSTPLTPPPGVSTTMMSPDPNFDVVTAGKFHNSDVGLLDIIQTHRTVAATVDTPRRHQSMIRQNYCLHWFTKTYATNDTITAGSIQISHYDCEPVPTSFYSGDSKKGVIGCWRAAHHIILPVSRIGRTAPVNCVTI